MALSYPRKGFGDFPRTLDGAIQFLTLAEDTCAFPQLRAAFGSAVNLLTTIRVFFPFPAGTNLRLTLLSLHQRGGQVHRHLELGMLWPVCADTCQTLHQRSKRERLDELGQPAFDAIQDLVT